MVKSLHETEIQTSHTPINYLRSLYDKSSLNKQYSKVGDRHVGHLDFAMTSSEIHLFELSGSLPDPIKKQLTHSRRHVHKKLQLAPGKDLPNRDGNVAWA